MVKPYLDKLVLFCYLNMLCLYTLRYIIRNFFFGYIAGCLPLNLNFKSVPKILRSFELFGVLEVALVIGWSPKLNTKLLGRFIVVCKLKLSVLSRKTIQVV